MYVQCLCIRLYLSVYVCVLCGRICLVIIMVHRKGKGMLRSVMSVRTLVSIAAESTLHHYN